MDKRTETIDSIVRNSQARGPGVWASVADAYDAGLAAERERIRSRLLDMDDGAAGRHNYYAHAAWVLFDRKA